MLTAKGKQLNHIGGSPPQYPTATVLLWLLAESGATCLRVPPLSPDAKCSPSGLTCITRTPDLTSR